MILEHNMSSENKCIVKYFTKINAMKNCHIIIHYYVGPSTSLNNTLCYYCFHIQPFIYLKPMQYFLQYAISSDNDFYYFEKRMGLRWNYLNVEVRWLYHR